MLEKLQAVEDKYRELESLISDPEVMADMTKWQAYTKEHAALTPIVTEFRRYKEVVKGIEEAKSMLGEALDHEMHAFVEGELADLVEQKEALDKELPILLLPKDPNDEKNVIVEIRGGVGGEEAALFAHSLWRMYTMYAARRGWQCETISENPTELGGVKEIVFSVEGPDVYSRLKFESGVHRVQRVPETETQGRIHTSTVTVAVMPEAEEVELEINPKDLRIDTFRSSGAGGQHINKTSSAIRVTHLPTGMVVECQDQRSQRENKDRALKVLRSRLLQQKQDAYDEEYNARRQSQVGSGDRSEKIRTYNFPQDRVTDHRIGLTLRNLQDVLDGDLDRVVEPLILADREEKLKQSSTEEGK